MEQSTFKFHIQNISFGWCRVLMLINDKEVWYNASYLGENPLETMIDACAYLMEEEGHYYISWQREPGTLKIELNLVDDMLQIDIFDEKVYYNEEAKEESGGGPGRGEREWLKRKPFSRWSASPCSSAAW